MDRRRTGMAVVACALVLAVAHPPIVHADLAIRSANPVLASVKRIELGIAGLSVIVTVTADAIGR